MYGDVDHDGDVDAVVEYEWDFSRSGGNGWGENIAVFRNNAGRFEWIADDEVGGKSSRLFKLIGIKNGLILGETLSDLKGTYACQEVGDNCVRRNVQLSLKGNKLIEK
jgi:hypothetical protein